MRTNSFLDSFKYMLAFGSWTTVAFDLLLLAGILIAIWSSSARSRPDAVSVWTCSWPSGTAVTSARYLVCYDGCVKAPKSTMGDCDLARHDYLAP